MANYDNTRNVNLNEIGDGYYANSFYGTYDHYQRIGWFFDKIVDTIVSNPESNKTGLDNCLDVLTGRFVLAKDDDAIFMRDYAYDVEGNYFQYYENCRYSFINGNFVPQEESIPIPVKGFRFIGFATRRSKLILNENGDYFDIEVNNETPYKIAKTKNIQQLSAYYFPTIKNQNVFKLGNNYTPITELEAISDIDNRENFDKNKYENDSYIIDDERRISTQ